MVAVAHVFMRDILKQGFLNYNFLSRVFVNNCLDDVKLMHEPRV